jgi:chaperonin GroES
MIKPVRKNVLVELIEKEKVTESGIILSSADPAEANKAKVIAVGSEVTEVQLDDMVLPNWNKAWKCKLADQDNYYMISEDEIVLVFE